MASGSQSGDTSLWLHNKLGTSNDSWTGGSIVSQLTPEILRKIQICFQDLQPQVKLKLLLSLFHIPKKNLEVWKSELLSILDVAKEDSEPWVCMLAELLHSYPASGQLNSEISVPESNKKIFSDLVIDLKKALKKCNDQNDSVLPLECHYLNKNAFISVVGHQPQTLKHFTLKRKPKAAALRAELVIKSQEASNKIKSTNSGCFPVRKSTMPRRMDSVSLKSSSGRSLNTSSSASSASASSSSLGFRNSHRTTLNSRSLGSNKKEGGVKLLDITEQPMGFAAARKRKRQQDLEDAQKKEMTNTTNTTTETLDSSESLSKVGKKSENEGPTPEYASGLSSKFVPPSYAPPTPTPAYAPPTSSLTVSQSAAQIARDNFALSLTSLEPLPPTSLTGITQSYAPPLGITTQPTQTRLITINNPRIIQTLPSIHAGNRVTLISSHRPTGPVSVVGTTTTTISQQQPQQQQQRLMTPINLRPIVRTTQMNSENNEPVQRHGLSLSKEHMLEANEMFQTANRVTRPEKALILGFMAGSRNNPCPHLGNLVTIKLSENQENVLQNDGTYLTMIIETHFQMNYSTGEWKRIKKYRRLEE